MCFVMKAVSAPGADVAVPPVVMQARAVCLHAHLDAHQSHTCSKGLWHGAISVKVKWRPFGRRD